MIGEITVTILGVKAVERELTKRQQRATDMRPVLRLLRKDFRSVMTKQFDSQGSYLGTPWAPLASATRQRKGRTGVDQRILHSTRRLRKSLTTGEEGFHEITNSSLEIGSAVEYAGYVSDGTSKMPAREIFPINNNLRRRWGKSMTLYLNNGILQIGPP